MAVTLPVQYRITTSSSITEETGVAVDMTDDGASASRDLYPRSYYEIQAEFGAMLPAENNAILAFLRTHRANEIDVSVDGIAYRCRIIRPASTKFLGGFLRQVTATFRGYAL